MYMLLPDFYQVLQDWYYFPEPAAASHLPETDMKWMRITAVVLGGVSLSGGEGRINQVMIGVVLMGVLSTGMIMCGINDYVQKLVKGIVLILAVAFMEFSGK